MAKPEWGTKRNCDSCGAKFYDFQRDPIICPKCDTKLTIVSATRSKRARTASSKAVAPKPTKAETGDDKLAAQVEDIDTDDDDDDDTLPEKEDDFSDDLAKVNAADDENAKGC